MNVPTREELAWCGGLWEGEGCFYTHKRPGRVNHGAAMSLIMTDFDTVEKFAAIIGAGSLAVKPPSPGRKAALKRELHGFEAMQACLAYFWPHLGKRRRAKAVEVLRIASLQRSRRRRCPHGNLLRTASGDCSGCKRDSRARIANGDRIYRSRA